MDLGDNHEYKGDWTEVDRKKRAVSIQQPDAAEVHPLFKVAIDVVAQVRDYPTLICLAMTCRTFWSLIYDSRTTRLIGFENLERERLPAERLGRQLGLGGSRAAGERACDWFCGITAVRHLGHLSRRQRLGYPFCQNDMLLPVENGETCNFDMLRHGTGQLSTFDWLPCYCCMRIKRKATHFFKNEYHLHRELLGCEALSRRCIDCSLFDVIWFDDMLRYLQDMPKGYQGYRLRCSICRKVERVFRRPKRRQQEKKMCNECFASLRAEAEVQPGHVFWEEWRWLSAIHISDHADQPKTKRLARTAYPRIPDQTPAEVQFGGQCRFEVLDIDCG